MKNLKITVNGQTYDVQVEEVGSSAPASVAQAPVAQVPAPAQAPAAIGGTKVEAPMPGTIMDIKVAQGAQVKSGDVLLVLEAMKMENEIKAPADGTVASINVEKGASVDTGALLCTLS